MAFFNLLLQLLLATRDLTARVSSLQPLLQVWAYSGARLCFGIGPARSLWVKPWMLGADPQVFCQSWFFSNTDPFLHRGIIILSLARHAGLVFLSAANWLWQHTSWCHTGTQVESSWCPKWSLGTSLSWSWVRGRMEWKIVQAHLWTKAVQNNRKN